MEERRARLLRETICRQNVAHNKWTRELWTRTHAQWSETFGAHARPARTLREIPAIGFSRPSYDNRFFFQFLFFFYFFPPNRTFCHYFHVRRPRSGRQPIAVSYDNSFPQRWSTVFGRKVLPSECLPFTTAARAIFLRRRRREPRFTRSVVYHLPRVSPLSTRTPARHPHHSPPHDREHIFQVSPLMLLLLLHGLRRLATTRTIDRASVVVVGTWLGVVVDSNRPDVPEFPFPGTAVRSLHVFSVVPIDCQSHRLRV